MPTEQAIKLAGILWSFHKIEQPPEKADLILGLGSYDLRVADHCARLLIDGWAPRIVFSGAQGNFTRGKWPKSEAEMFADRAVEFGAPGESILIEPEATNTGDNVRFTRDLLDRNDMEITSVILVSKPNMNRRGLATMEQWWPEVHVRCSHPNTHFLHSPAPGYSPDDVIHEIVGDFQRIVEYPKQGFQTEQEISRDTFQAYESLIDLGYTGHLLAD